MGIYGMVHQPMNHTINQKNFEVTKTAALALIKRYSNCYRRA